MKERKGAKLSAQSPIEHAISCNNSSLFVFFSTHSLCRQLLNNFPTRCTFVHPLETMDTCLCRKSDKISLEFVCRAPINRYQVFPFVIYSFKVHLPVPRLVASLCFRLWLMKIMRNITYTYMQCVFGAATTSLVYHPLLLSANINITPHPLPACRSSFLCVRVHMFACLV